MISSRVQACKTFLPRDVTAPFPTYLVKIGYWYGGNFITAHSQSCSPDESGEIDIQLDITHNAPCGTRNAVIELYNLVYMPSPHWELVTSQTIRIDGGPCP